MKYRIGIDIGGTKIAAGLLHGDTLLEQCLIPTHTGCGGAERSVKALSEDLFTLIQKRGLAYGEISGVGIGCAGPVDTINGTVENPYTLPGWEGFPLVRNLQDILEIRCVLGNDADTALLGAVAAHSLWDDDVVMVTFGTGVGVSAFLKGKLFETRCGQHPELGHILVDDSASPEICYCGVKGCFESLWSGTAVNRAAHELGYLDFDALYAAYLEKQHPASDWMQKSRKWFRDGMWNILLPFMPQKVILSGGLSKRYFSLMKSFLTEPVLLTGAFLPEYTLLHIGQDLELILLGAASLINL